MGDKGGCWVRLTPVCLAPDSDRTADIPEDPLVPLSDFSAKSYVERDAPKSGQRQYWWQADTTLNQSNSQESRFLVKITGERVVIADPRNAFQQRVTVAE
jgi:hypothetical protein